MSYNCHLPNHLMEAGGLILNSQEEVNLFQQRLVELVHASTCVYNNVTTYACSLPYCAYTKVFLTHMNDCNSGVRCPQSCYRSQMLLSHWNKCSQSSCQLCSYVRQKLIEHENFFRSSSRFYDQSKMTNTSAATQASDLIIDLSTDDDIFLNPPTNYIENSQELNTNSQADTPLESPAQSTRHEHLKVVLDRYLYPMNYRQEQPVPLNLTKTEPLSPPAERHEQNFTAEIPMPSTSGINLMSLSPLAPPLPPVWPVSRVRHCRRCRNHGQTSECKNHGICPFMFCPCSKCTARSSRRNRFRPYLVPPVVAQEPEVASEFIVSSHSSNNDALAQSDDAAKIHHEGKADWITFTRDLNKGCLVEGGRSCIGDISYVGRGYCNGHLLPAAIFLGRDSEIGPTIKVTFNGKTHLLEKCEALIVADYEWKQVDGGNIPSNAVFSGIVDNEDVQYVGRARHNLSLVTGRVSKESGCLLIPYGDAEVVIQSYEVLVDNSSASEVISESQKPVISPPPLELPTEPSKRKGNECAVCYESPVVGIFKTCLHACLCADCIDIVNRRKEYNGKVMCPICRKLSDKAEKFFMS